MIFLFLNFLPSLIKALAVEFTQFVRTAGGKAPKERDKNSWGIFSLNEITAAPQPLF